MARAKKKGAARRTPSRGRKPPAIRASARGGRNTGRRTAGARTPKGKAARKKPRKPPRRGKRIAAAARSKGKKQSADRPRRGGTGMERELAQTAAAGRSVEGPTNPFPTKRSTGTPSGAGSTRRSPALERERRQLREIEETIPGPPSSLNLDQHGSAARTGRAELRQARHEHTETSPAMTGGDVDADWEDAYSVGDEAPGGDNPTPDQDRVDDIGKALGVQYEDSEELKAADKIAERDRHRWELDPASSEDYKDRTK
jgi:Family of unknown function (DUF6335)